MKKKIKKILISLGAIIPISTSAVTVVSCGKKESALTKNWNTFIQKVENENVVNIVDSLSIKPWSGLGYQKSDYHVQYLVDAKEEHSVTALVKNLVWSNNATVSIKFVNGTPYDIKNWQLSTKPMGGDKWNNFVTSSTSVSPEEILSLAKTQKMDSGWTSSDQPTWDIYGGAVNSANPSAFKGMNGKPKVDYENYTITVIISINKNSQLYNNFVNTHPIEAIISVNKDVSYNLNNWKLHGVKQLTDSKLYMDNVKNNFNITYIGNQSNPLNLFVVALRNKWKNFDRIASNINWKYDYTKVTAQIGIIIYFDSDKKNYKTTSKNITIIVTQQNQNQDKNYGDAFGIADINAYE